MARPLPPAEALNLVPLADIARGGMGSVQLCQVDGGRLGGRVLAVKRLNPELERDPQFVNMFIDETWMTAAIKSPNVIHVEAWGQDAQGHYLAVELVQGVSLSRLVKESRAQKEPFSERTVACILSQICAGLEAAHSLRDEQGAPLNLVHRDLTPGNILIGFDGVVKIADFGIAKANARLTQTTAGTMKGKPSYMAPEQARGLPVDGRADLFSLGVMAYELLSGTRPWTGASDFDILLAVSSTEPADLSEHRQVDPVFLEITRGCLTKDRDKRFGSAGEIRQRIDAWRQIRGFVADDLASLSAFVKRNTPKQLDWFQRALAGRQRDGATFKDVEEQIDRARRPSPSTDPRRSAAQGKAPAPPVPSGTIPMMPPDGAAAIARAALLASPPAASTNAPGARPLPDVDDLAKTRMVVDDLAATRMVDDLAATRMVEPLRARGPEMNLGGTVALSAEEIARSRGAGPVGQPQPPPPPPSSPVAHLRPPPPRSQPSGGWPAAPYSAGPSSGPISVGAPSSHLGWSGPASHGGPPSSGAPAPRSSQRGPDQFVFQAEPLPIAPPKKKGGGRVAVALLLIVLVAGAAAAYWMRARLGLHP